MKPNAEIMFVIAIFIFFGVFLIIPLGFAVSGLRRMWQDQERIAFMLLVGVLGLVVCSFVGVLVAAALRAHA